MRILLLLFILFNAWFLVACNTKKDVRDEDEYIVKDVIVTSIEEIPEPPPPPPHSESRFKNINDWLVHICETESPQKPIETFRIGVFESSNDYTINLAGTNTYEVSPNVTEVRIDFQPESYFLITHEYMDLQRAQLLERLSSQIKDFLRTEKFKRSFLSQAKTITLDWEGEIWSK